MLRAVITISTSNRLFCWSSASVSRSYTRKLIITIPYPHLKLNFTFNSDAADHLSTLYMTWKSDNNGALPPSCSLICCVMCCLCFKSFSINCTPPAVALFIIIVIKTMLHRQLPNLAHMKPLVWLTDDPLWRF